MKTTLILIDAKGTNLIYLSSSWNYIITEFTLYQLIYPIYDTDDNPPNLKSKTS